MDNQTAQTPTSPQPVQVPPIAASAPRVSVEKSSSSPFMISVAIVLAGALIGGTVYSSFTNQNKILTKNNNALVAASTGATTATTTDYNQYINATMYQAVFLSDGQVYFGKIKKADKELLILTDIYYLRTGTTAKTGASVNNSAITNDASLAKLGSELHAPEDQMTIRMAQVSFWENLKPDGNVVKAITEYKKTHP